MKKLPFLFLFLAVCQFGRAQTEKPLYEIHAQMIYNFIKYVQWPGDTEPGEFIVGVIGEDDVFNTLKSYYEGKPKGAKKYSIRKLGSAAETGICSVVYLGKSKSRDFDDIKAATTGKPVLTITDSGNLGKKGSCINFKIIDGKLKFELNQGTIATSTLKVSTQLSSMAILL